MAILSTGITRCSICDKVLEPGQSVRCFPSFIADKLDPLWRYSDSAMHEECFSKWEHRNLMIAKYNCAIGQRTEEPDQPKTRIAIIGTPVERESYLEQLQRATHACDSRLTGIWADRNDILDNYEFARELRRQAEKRE